MNNNYYLCCSQIDSTKCCSSCHYDAEEYEPSYPLSLRVVKCDDVDIYFEYCCGNNFDDEKVIEFYKNEKTTSEGENDE